MRAIAYHYVRHSSPSWPYFTFLNVDDFRRQIKWFSAEGRLVNKSEFLDSVTRFRPIPNAFILTFDDGIVDHYEYVLPILREFATFGVFYIPTGPYVGRRMLSVHMAHLLLGCVPAPRLLDALLKLLAPDMLVWSETMAISSQAYRGQRNIESVSRFKKLINYEIRYECLDLVLDELSKQFLAEPDRYVDSFYLSETQISEMAAEGMIIGGHGVNHRCLARLGGAEWRAEMAESMEFVESIVGPSAPRTFCYPYGGRHNYPAEAPNFAAELGCMFSFDVRSEPITVEVLQTERQAMPRYDCNEFPHGKATGGWRPDPATTY